MNEAQQSALINTMNTPGFPILLRELDGAVREVEEVALDNRDASIADKLYAEARVARDVARKLKLRLQAHTQPSETIQNFIPVQTG